jgi:hypothetical protein
MKAYDISGPIIVVAGLIGLSAGLVLNQGLLDIDSIVLDQSQSGQDSANRIGEVGSAHDHASFHVMINGTEKDFTDRKFQLNSRYVHLENNRSDIVHKHANGITWSMFFQTINLSTSIENDRLCLEIYGNRSCGTGSLVLNGDFNPSLDQEISQGDSLLIVLDTKEWRDISKEYMNEQLPENYRPKIHRGRSV